MQNKQTEEMPELTSENVREVLDDCFLTSATEIPESEYVNVLGVINAFGFHPGRVKKNTSTIRMLLSQLDPKFTEGWSFMNVPFRADGSQWGEQKNAEQLVVLGVAAGLVESLPEKPLHAMFPGGVPYVTVLREVFEDQKCLEK